MSTNQITVLASYVTELIFHIPRLMRLGETIEGNFEIGHGGKGFNMAVAAKRAGGNVRVIMKIGSDAFGDTAVRILASEGISVENVLRHEPGPSGTGVVLLLPSGENAIAIDSGSNDTLTEQDIESCRDTIRRASVLLAPLEFPVPAIEYAFGIAKESGCLTILNPAPARELPDDVYRRVDVLTPNETEAETISGVSLKNEYDIMKAANKLMERGVRNVIITRGKKPVFYTNGESGGFVSPPAVDAVDTTGAGDAFNGALAISLSRGCNLVDAVRFATKYAALKVTRKGTAISMPTRKEVDEFEYHS